MSYKITIKETTTETKTVRGEYTKIGEKEEKGKYTDKINMVADFGYAPDREEEVTEERTVYTQEVDDLNLVAVIDAVNSKPPMHIVPADEDIPRIK